MAASKILVLNTGSSSIKYQLFAMPEGTVLATGKVERIGEPVGILQQSCGANTVKVEEPIVDHSVGLRRMVELLTEGVDAPLADLSDVTAVGHRVVHGGERFSQTVAIDDEVLSAIEEHAALAPLHNPPNLLGIRAARGLLGKDVPQVAVFDTAFHQTMPARAYRYALPTELYEDAGIRRYGFHGTSHRFVAARATKMLGREASDVNLITCHLGNGSSIAAIRGGESIDTSMGLTPLEGLVMGTRCGDLDPAIIFHLAGTRGLSLAEINAILNKKSGLLGLSGKSNDVRELLRLEREGDEAASLAIDVLVYRLKKYIGAYFAILGRLDALVFTAGVGENAPTIRARVCDGMEHLGIAIDRERNESAVGTAADISTSEAPTRTLVVPTDEERLIAQDTYALARATISAG